MVGNLKHLPLTLNSFQYNFHSDKRSEREEAIIYNRDAKFFSVRSRHRSKFLSLLLYGILVGLCLCQRKGLLKSQFCFSVVNARVQFTKQGKIKMIPNQL